MADLKAFQVVVVTLPNWAVSNHAYAMWLGHQHHAGT
jgi:hypothetical protein